MPSDLLSKQRGNEKKTKEEKRKNLLPETQEEKEGSRKSRRRGTSSSKRAVEQEKEEEEVYRKEREGILVGESIRLRQKTKKRKIEERECVCFLPEDLELRSSVARLP